MKDWAKTQMFHEYNFLVNKDFDRTETHINIHEYNILQMKISAKTRIKIHQGTLAKEVKKLPKLKSIFWGLLGFWNELNGAVLSYGIVPISLFLLRN